MKRNLIIAVALFFSAVAQAQPKEGTFSIIPRLGLSIANLSNDYIYTGDASTESGHEFKSKHKAGLLAGVDLEYQALPVLGVSLGAYYSMQGCRYSNDEVERKASEGAYIGVSEMSTNLQYINVSLMASLYVAPNFAIKAGVQVGFNIDGNMKMTETDFTRDDLGAKEYGTPKETKTEISTKKIDFAIPIGVSYEYMNVILDARYNIGLTGTSDLPGLDSPKNSVITVSAGYRFKL